MTDEAGVRLSEEAGDAANEMARRVAGRGSYSDLLAAVTARAEKAEATVERVRALADEWEADAAIHAHDEHKAKIRTVYGEGECDTEERLSKWHADALRAALGEEHDDGRRGLLSRFTSWVATHRAYNGSDAKHGQSLYNECLNAVLPVWADEFLSEEGMMGTETKGAGTDG